MGLQIRLFKDQNYCLSPFSIKCLKSKVLLLQRFVINFHLGMWKQKDFSSVKNYGSVMAYKTSEPSLHAYFYFEHLFTYHNITYKSLFTTDQTSSRSTVMCILFAQSYILSTEIRLFFTVIISSTRVQHQVEHIQHHFQSVLRAKQHWDLWVTEGKYVSLLNLLKNYWLW